MDTPSNEPPFPSGVVMSGVMMSKPAVSAQAPRTAASASAEPWTIEPTAGSVYKAGRGSYVAQEELRLYGKGGPFHGHPKLVWLHSSA